MVGGREVGSGVRDKVGGLPTAWGWGWQHRRGGRAVLGQGELQVDRDLGGHSADPPPGERAPWPEVCSGCGVGLQALLPSSASIQHVVLAPAVCTRRVMPALALWLS